MYKIIFAAAFLILSPSFATAGGGSTKSSTGTIRVINGDGGSLPFDAVLVAVNPSVSLLASTTLDEWIARGGRVLEPGQRFDFTKLKAGSNRVVHVFADQNDDLATLQPFVVDQSVTVTGGKTTTVTLVPST